MNPQNKTNTLAITISFSLIILIAIITVSRSYINKSRNASVENAIPLIENKQDEAIQKNSSQLSSEDLLKKIRSSEKIIMIDLRNSDDFELEHIIDSKNISLREITSENPLIDKNIPYVLIGDSNRNNILIAKDALQKKGALHVYFLKDSFQEWKEQNNPTISFGIPDSFVDKAKAKYITSDEFNGIINTDSNLLILDLRGKESYQNEHIKGAINILLKDLEARRREIPLGKNIVLYDKDGLWAFQGAVRLSDLGFFNVLYLSDGLDAWKAKNYPLEN